MHSNRMIQSFEFSCLSSLSAYRIFSWLWEEGLRTWDSDSLGHTASTCIVNRNVITTNTTITHTVPSILEHRRDVFLYLMDDMKTQTRGGLQGVVSTAPRTLLTVDTDQHEPEPNYDILRSKSTF